MVADAGANPPAAAPSPAVLVRGAASALAALSIVAFQLGILPFFQPMFAEDGLVWPVLYYGYWLLVALATAATLLLDARVRLQALPIIVVCILTVALTLLHPLDGIAKNLIVSMGFIACLSVLVLGSMPLLLVRFSASVTALNAVICLIDVLFADGLTSSVGRAAGLAQNPNLAAAGLLLGAAAAYWAVPRRWQVPFLVLVAVAVAVTLSRSTMLAALMIVVGMAIIGLIRRLVSRERRPIDWRRLFLGLPILVALLLWVGVALLTNDRFVVAAGSSISGLGNAVTAFQQASLPVTQAVQNVTVSPPAHTTMSEADVQAALRAERVAAEIQAISVAAASEGETNSVSARGLLMQRAFLSYVSGPPLGSGLQVAHDLVPHNTFLLFALAFGHLGWLVPLAFVVLALYRARSVSALPLSLAMAAAMMTSHDVLLFPSLVIPFAVGMAGIIGARTETTMQYTSRALPIAAAAGTIFFAICCGVLVTGYLTQHYRVGSGQGGILPSSGYAYVAAIQPPPYTGVLRFADVAPGNAASMPILREDGVAMPAGSTALSEIETLGEGRYGLYKRTAVLFSASDNSDPRANGRVYDLDVPLTGHPLALLVLGVLLLWCLAVITGMGRRQAQR